MLKSNSPSFRPLGVGLVLGITLALGACGSQSPAPAAGAAQLSLALPQAPGALDTVRAVPGFHVAPVLLGEPAETDAIEPDSSARQGPHTERVPAEFAALSTRRLTWAALDAARREGASPPADAHPTPLGSGTAVATYTPAQIRAAYGLPALPAPGASVTTAQAAALGAGQTIYLVDARDDPNAAAELAAFNQKFGLPGCTTQSVSVAASLPLPPAPTSGCTFSVVYASPSGQLAATAPAYDSGWATEIALDVQWSHAIAPYARIVLVEGVDASLSSLLGGVSLANAMGPGVVSMSFGAGEGSYTASVDGTFTASGMTYLAAAGDSGAGVEWPAVSPHVLAVGGTSLTYTGSGPRSEVVWSGTGGGVSAYTAAPAYQTSAVPGLGTPGHRAVSDVAFNADPSTGQYVATINPGSTTAGWLSAGGTSLATPQWAALIAIANAQRAQGNQPPLGQPHALLYTTIATSPTAYPSVFSDVTQGSDGSCATCAAHAGYDLPTGLGTPNAVSLLAALTGTVSTGPTAPVVGSAAVTATVGTPLTFAVSVTDAHPVTYTLSGAPAGLAIGANGTVTWPSPVLGTYAVKVTALDTQTGLSGSGTYTITVGAPKAPVVNPATIPGTVGQALNFPVSVTDPNPVTIKLSGAPSGMTLSAAGVVSWPSTVAGSYAVVATASDAKTGLSGSGTYTVTISPPQPPTVSSGSVTGTPGVALSFTVTASDPNPVSFALTGAPAGMTVAGSGVVTWVNPVAGRYTVGISATDTKTGLTGKGSYTVTIVPAGPVITAAPMSGVAGHPLSGTITFSDATSNSLSIAIGGVPAGMGFAVSGSSLVATWPSPVAGSYKLSIQATDGNGRTGSVTVPITVSAH